jgi:hypothetical protein
MAGYVFKMSPLPKAVFDLLRAIATGEGMTQRAVIAAGVLALARLKRLDEAQAADVLAEAKTLCPRRDAPPTAA